MFQRPVVDEYATYGAYALAALGYAMVVEGDVAGGCVEIMCNGGGGDYSRCSGCCARVHAVASGTGSCGAMVVGSEVRRNVGVRCSVGVDSNGVDDLSGVGDVRSEKSVSSGGSSGLGVSGDRLGPRGGVSKGRGPNYARNQVARARKKEYKSRVGRPSGVKGVKAGESCASSGFWASCEEEIRKELIESKARMHIASNNKKAAEDVRRLDHLRSPAQMLKDLMKIVELAGESAKQQNDSKVAGWAATVAQSYAESVARSASTSVESFDAFVAASGGSSTVVDVQVHEDVIRQLQEEKKRNVELEAKLRSVPMERSGGFVRKPVLLEKNIGNIDALRTQFEKELKVIDAKYDAMDFYDPYFLAEEKKMVRKQAKYKVLFS